MIFSAFLQKAKDQPTRTLFSVLVEGKLKKISYGTLLTESLRFSSFYKSQNVQKGYVIILVLDHGPELLYAFLGALLIGAIPTIFPPKSPKISTELIKDSMQKLFKLYKNYKIVTSKELSSLFSEELLLNCNDYSSQAPYNVALFVNEEISPAFLQHSSGTTGLKKGVLLTHESVLSQVSNYSAAIGLRSEDSIISWLPLYHDMGLITSFILPLITGTPSLLISPFDWVRKPELLFEWTTKEKTTLCWMPNFAFHFLASRIKGIAKSNYNLSSMRAWISCSESITQQSFQMFTESFGDIGVSEEKLAGCYAMAENTFAVTQTALGQSPKKGGLNRISSGSAIPGCEVKIIDGEIAIRGTSLFSGYYLRPDLTSDSFKNGWYLTGDLGSLQNGELFVTGRKKDLLIVAGKNLYPEDIEEGISRISGIYPGRVVATSRFNSKLGTQEIIILAEVEEGFTSTQQLKSQIVAWLRSEFEVSPQRIALLPRGWLVKSTSGKPSRSANLEKFQLSAPSHS